MSESWLRRHSEIASVVALFVAALVARVLLLIYVSPRPQKLFTPDSFGYDQIALNLLHLGVFSAQTQQPFAPDLKRTPGYPAFVAAVYAFNGRSPEAVVIVQILLAAATVVLVYLLSRQLGLSHRGSLLAAAVLALEPVSAMTSVLLLSETLFAFLLVLSLLAVVRWRRGQTLWLVAAALISGPDLADQARRSVPSSCPGSAHDSRWSGREGQARPGGAAVSGAEPRDHLFLGLPELPGERAVCPVQCDRGEPALLPGP